MIRRTRVAGRDQVKLTFSLPADTPAGQVSVVGDFNDWRPGSHVLVKRANGQRSAAVTVPAGSTVRFRYLATDGVWFDDPDADSVDADGGLLRV